MTIYTWGQRAPVEQMETLPFGKEQEAVLHARDGVEPARLSAIREMFHSLGVAVIPDEVEGKPVLRLRGFENGEFLAKALEQNGFAGEQERSERPSEKKKEKGSFADKIRSRSVMLSGWVYMIGDAALIASGWKRGDKNEAYSGLAYGAASVVTAGWGHRKPEKVFDDLYSRMLGEFARDGVELPKGTELTAKELGKPGGLLSRMDRFLSNYPVQIFVAGNAVAGFNLFRAGVNQGNNDKKIAGALVMTGMLISLLVPEKAKKPEAKSIGEMAQNLQDGADAGQVWKQPEMEKPKGIKGMLAGVGDWIQEKPLRVGGYLAMGNNLFMIKGAMTERASNPLQKEYLTALKEKRFADAEQYKLGGASNKAKGLKSYLTKNEFNDLDKLSADASSGVQGVGESIDARLDKLEKANGAWQMNMAAAASYLVANGLLSISSTKGGHGGGGADSKDGKDPNEELYAAAAAIIANQPEEVQDAVINKMATFLASQREISMPVNELTEKMREKVTAVKDSPWLAPSQHGERREASPIPDHVPDEWVQKEALRNAAAKDTGLTGATR